MAKIIAKSSVDMIKYLKLTKWNQILNRTRLNVLAVSLYVILLLTVLKPDSSEVCVHYSYAAQIACSPKTVETFHPHLVCYYCKRRLITTRGGSFDGNTP